jgi:hypothetical protein
MLLMSACILFGNLNFRLNVVSSDGVQYENAFAKKKAVGFDLYLTVHHQCR